MIPGTFIGTVTIDGEPAPDGTIIQAVMNGIVWGTTEAEEGGYILEVPKMLVSWSPCGEFELGTVEFYIDGLKADESPGWHDGLNKVNLTFFTQGSGMPAAPVWRMPRIEHFPQPAALTPRIVPTATPGTTAAPTPGTTPMPTPDIVPTPASGTPSTFAAMPSPDVVAMPVVVPAGGLGTEPVGGETWWPLGLVAAAGLVGAAALIAFGAEAWYVYRRL